MTDPVRVEAEFPNLTTGSGIVPCMDGGRHHPATRLAEGLLKTGALVASGKSVDTELGTWSKANNWKFKCNADHNSHVQVALDDSKLLK